MAQSLDLRGVPCPLSWAKAKLQLEALRRGDTLELLLDDPKAARDIPRAAEIEGFDVIAVAQAGDVWRLVIEK